MIEMLVYLVILVIVAIFLYWLLTQIPLPEPLHKIAIIVLVALGVIVLIWLLMNFAGMGSLRMPR